MFLDALRCILATTAGDRIALRSSSNMVTYAELSRDATTIALALLERGIGEGELVALYGPRRLELVVGMIGIMLSGAAYTVVEASGFRDEELHRIQQIAPSLVLSLGDAPAGTDSSGIPWMPVPLMQHESRSFAPVCRELPKVPGDAPAYVLYTSGSTGQQKGVAVTHSNLAHYCEGLATRLGIVGPMTFAHVSTLSADLGNTCLFLSLWTAGTLYLADDFERKDPTALASALAANQVDVLKITPTHWRSILAACKQYLPGRAPLRWLFLGGERLQAKLARTTLESGVTQQLLNHYGPTEATIGVTVCSVNAHELPEDGQQSVPIGRSFGQTTLCVLCADGAFRYSGAEGELYIGGPSVAQGYWKRSDLTEERFVVPEGMDQRFYRTGDRVHIDQSGLVTFLGRVDRQVKVNGYRVELDHVEQAVRQVDGIEQSIVVHHREDERDYLLCGYEGTNRNALAIRTHLQQTLPAHMIPAVIEHYGRLPTNPNGKLDAVLVRTSLAGLVRSRHDVPSRASSDREDRPLEIRLLEKFGAFCRTSHLTADDNFFELGADSLDAIQLISELQLAGLPVTARGFLACPTVRGLVALCDGHAPERAPMPDDQAVHTGPYPCSPAQTWFFSQRFAEPNRWTQSMLLELGMNVDPELLAPVFDRVVDEYDSLRLRFMHDEVSGKWFFEPMIRRENVLSVHAAAGSSMDVPQVFEPLVKSRYNRLERSLDIFDGRVFGAELLLTRTRQYLLLVAHHLVIDVISWRVLLDELMRRYAIARGAEPEASTGQPTPFGVWTKHLLSNRSQLAADLPHWQHLPPAHGRRSGAGTERDAHTGWLTLSPAETEIMTETAATLGTTVDHFVLACYIEQCAQTWPENTIHVQIESHGRLCLSDDIDVSRTIGWFTSSFPVSLRDDQIADPQFPKLLHDRLAAVPNLGHAYGLVDAGQWRAPYCFNFVGHSRLGLRNDWKLKPASLSLPGLRGEMNDRVYRLKLTGRLVEGSLILDLNFDASTCSSSAIQAYLRGFRQRLAKCPDLAAARQSSPSILASNSTGALWNIPAEVLAPAQKTGRRRAYGNVLLTGATGFIGIHVLRELLLNSRAHIYCIVRQFSSPNPQARLLDAWGAYFGRGEIDSHMHRITVLTGDMTRPSLGISEEAWERVAMNADAIYHLAADTRLVGARRDMQANILHPIREILRLVGTGKSKDLHFMSTLAVSGSFDGDSPRVFDEDSLDIGQTFLNEYERAKFEAESIVRDFGYLGHTVFIYRSGNVTGDSRTGLFQRNAGANRWIQCLRAIACSGHAPRTYSEPLALSPVDIVARGIVHLSLNRDLAGGTYHVDCDNTVPASQFVDALRAVGVHITPVETDRLDEALAASGKLKEHDIAVGYFWASRGARNVRYDNGKTLALLAENGIHFPPITPEWVHLFVSRLYHSGFLIGSPQSSGACMDHVPAVLAKT